MNKPCWKLVVEKLWPVSNMAFLGLQKMLDLIILYTLKSVSEYVNLIILFFYTKINVLFCKYAFFRPEEAMLETGKRLSTESKLVLF